MVVSLAKPAPCQRQHPRIRIIDSLDVSFAAPQGQPQLRGELEDISLSGMRFKTEAKIREKAVFDIEILFPAVFENYRNAFVRGEVIHTYKLHGQRNSRVGVHFTEMGLDEKDKISEFINWLAHSWYAN